MIDFETHPERYLVKILLPDGKTINGTGFFCTPEGHIFTCYHVISPWVEKLAPRCTVRYMDENYSATICTDNCLENTDIAVLRINDFHDSIFYCPLDIHTRYKRGDEVYSFGFPQKKTDTQQKHDFMEKGASIQGRIGNRTHHPEYSYPIFPITDLSVGNVWPGYSGAPVFHNRTERVIGLINARYSLTQCFFVPLEGILSAWPELRDSHDVFGDIRFYILEQLEKDFRAKLRGKAYIHLSLREGRIPEMEEHEEGREQKENVLIGEHGRIWEDFDSNMLLPPSGWYILSSSVGSGKTTFLYWLASELISKTDMIPVVITCADFQRCHITSWKDVKNYLIERALSSHSEVDLNDFYETAWDSRKLVFLFDGLDQISGPKYSEVTEDIKIACGSNPLLVTSRPSAVISIEQNREIAFLALQNFSRDAQKDYYGQYFEEAKRIARFAPDLVRVPMLAFMVLTMIIKGKAKDVSTKTMLYEQFIGHIIYTHDKRGTEDWQLCDDIKKALQYFSYVSMEHGLIQKITFESYSKIAGDEKVSCSLEQLISFGLVNQIIEGEGQSGRFLYFTHQTFQEFLAAQYVGKHPDLVEKLVDELWNPKWREVIKFLSGLLGDEIVHKVLKQDNVIHSGLFLAAECVREVVGINKKLSNEIKAKIKPLISGPFLKKAIYALGQMEEIESLFQILTIYENNQTNMPCMLAKEVLDELEEQVTDLQFAKLKEVERYLDVERACYSVKRAKKRLGKSDKWEESDAAVVVEFLNKEWDSYYANAENKHELERLEKAGEWKNGQTDFIIKVFVNFVLSQTNTKYIEAIRTCEIEELKKAGMWENEQSGFIINALKNLLKRESRGSVRADMEILGVPEDLISSLDKYRIVGDKDKIPIEDAIYILETYYKYGGKIPSHETNKLDIIVNKLKKLVSF